MLNNQQQNELVNKETIKRQMSNSMLGTSHRRPNPHLEFLYLNRNEIQMEKITFIKETLGFQLFVSRTNKELNDKC